MLELDKGEEEKVKNLLKREILYQILYQNAFFILNNIQFSSFVTPDKKLLFMWFSVSISILSKGL